MLSLAFASVLVVGGIDVDVATLDGNTAAGQLVRLTDEGLELKADTPLKIDLSALLTLTVKDPAAPPEVIGAVRVDLVDGSRLLATEYTVSAGKAEIALVGGKAITVPTGSVHSVRFQSQNEDVVRQWDEIENSDLRGDVVVVRKSVEDATTGVPTYSLDYLEGVLSDVSNAAVQFTFDADRVDVPRTKLDGLIYFHPPGRELPGTLCSVIDTGGSQFNAKTVRVEEDQLNLELASGVGHTMALTSLRKIDFSAGRIVFLSDLTPSTVDWSSYLDVSRTLPSLARLYHPRSDRSFGGGKLRLKVGRRLEEYAKGLAIHSRTSLIYQLPSGMRRFQAIAGIDESVRTGGHVRLVIHGDNQELVNEIVAVGQEPIPIDVEVTDVRRLKILVDFGEQLDIGDSLHLCNARVTK
jgi:hypothetical protein